SVWMHPRAGYYNYGIRARLRPIVGTRGSTHEFSGPAFEVAVQRAVDALLNGLTLQLTNEIRQNGAGGKLAHYKLEGDALNWWNDFKQAKGGLSNKSFVGKKAGPKEEQAKHFKWVLCDWILDGIVNKEFTDVAQVANDARNIEIIHERSSQNNKRNHDRDRIRPIAQDSNQRGYDQKGYDGRRYDRQGDNSNQKLWQNRRQQYNRSFGQGMSQGYWSLFHLWFD
ncbi:hypothetical protein Tco_1287846, partial [Tanacetum coccineum]